MSASDYTFDFSLFSAFGVELEYMIVDAETLDVRPLAELVLAAEGGPGASDVAPASLLGIIEWSNELTAHVLEFKTGGPSPSLDGLADHFHQSVLLANRHLQPAGAMLLPAAMHPWMNPDREMVLWPLGYGDVYALLDAIFSCRGHGWANLQSVHINLPFANDAEFGRLHAAVRCILPIIPALAASSPFTEGTITGLLDTRLETYRTNSRAIPACAAEVIPEQIFTRDAYEREIFARIDRELAPHDPKRILHHEWMNARGCIARFMRGAIEIRLIDMQECPESDLAIVRLVSEAIRALAEEQLSATGFQRTLDVNSLHAVLLRCIRHGEAAIIDHPDLLRALGVTRSAMAAGDLWSHLRERTLSAAGPWDHPLNVIERRGTLATRLLRSVGAATSRHAAAPHRPEPAIGGTPVSRDALTATFRRLAACLAENRPMDGEG